jgi:hypothetical protein
MIEDKDILFVTTTINSKWLQYNTDIIKTMFPESEHILIDGSNRWPNSWFYWIDYAKNSSKKYYIHLDEDCFLNSKGEVLRALNLLNEEYDVLGVPDAYIKEYRHHNPIVLNTFLMMGKIEDLKDINIDFKNLTYNCSFIDGVYKWYNSANLYYKENFSKDFVYKHKIQGERKERFDNECEPYYAFQWLLKEKGLRFGYLFPFHDERFQSTNPRIDENSDDIAIHMWYVRAWNSPMIVSGLPNNERYKLIEEWLLKRNY